jgi:phosphoribosylformimino-5-aminoimidazole carboxamide ribotide isomerase
MIAIPAVELQDRNLATGERTSRTSAAVYGGPGLAARELTDLGFTHLQLDGCTGDRRGSGRASALEEIVRDTGAKIQVAEARTGSEVERLLQTGADHVVVGARALDEPEWLAEIADLYPDAIVVSAELRDRRVVRRGWIRTLPHDIVDVVEELNAFPLAGVLVGGLQLDGVSRNADLMLVEDLAERSRSPLIVSAKVTTLDDLRALEHRGAVATVLRAEYLNGALDSRVVAREFGG